MTFVARTATDASTALPALKEAVRSLVPGQTFPTAATLEQLVDVTMVPRRFYLVLAGTLAAFALFLAAIGIYSLIAFVTVQRTREFGVRMALGGSRREILRLVLANGMIAPLAGIVVGGADSSCDGQASRVVSVRHRPGRSRDVRIRQRAESRWWPFGSRLSAPALRAIRTDPTVALRHESVRRARLSRKIRGRGLSRVIRRGGSRVDRPARSRRPPR